MKKIILILALAFLVNTLHANKITINNMTNCDFGFSFRGLDDPLNPSTYFESTQIIVPSGTTIYNSPADVPGLSYLTSTATFYYIKGGCTEPPVAGASGDASVGSPGWGVPQSLNSAINNYFPVCNNNTAFTIIWGAGGTGDITVYII